MWTKSPEEALLSRNLEKSPKNQSNLKTLTRPTKVKSLFNKRNHKKNVFSRWYEQHPTLRTNSINSSRSGSRKLAFWHSLLLLWSISIVFCNFDRESCVLTLRTMKWRSRFSFAWGSLSSDSSNTTRLWLFWRKHCSIAGIWRTRTESWKFMTWWGRFIIIRET